MMMWSQLPLATMATLAAAQSSGTIAQSGSHTDIPRWCGKPYMAGAPNFPPGGMLHAPTPSQNPMLFVQVTSRYTIYDSSEDEGEFLVEASMSDIHGEPFASSYQQTQNLTFDIRMTQSNKLLISDSIAISPQPQSFTFDLSGIEPRLKPYQIHLQGSVDKQNYSATTKLYYLPAKNSGSTVKVDNLHGGLVVANAASNYAFTPLLPFGFYTSCSGYLNYSRTNVTDYKDMGFNAINPVCAFTDGDLGYLFNWLDDANLWYQYDMRGSYLNLSSVREQVPLIKDRPAFLSWYTADEPDGWQYALDSTTQAYDLLRELDPYHPTALVLNCQNYHFKQYSAGADYLMEDVYPVGINESWSKWGTVCNETYGDCGCDNCVGNLQDVSTRLDDFYQYQQWIGRWEKPLWAVLQVFHGEGYWSRDPTQKETWAMMLLSFNHKAKGMMSWDFPASKLLEKAHATFAKVAVAPPVSGYLLSVDPVALNVSDKLDVAYWVDGGGLMVGVVNLDYGHRHGKVSIELPFAAKSIDQQPWGSGVKWKLTPGNNSSTISVNGLEKLSTSIIILQI